MAKQVSLKASSRTNVGRSLVRKTREAAKIPAVIYGSHIKATPIQVDSRELENIFKHATSENMLVDLALEENGKTSNRLAFIQEIQHHPLTDRVLHLDFHEIRADEKLHARVAIIAVGEPEGVRTGGGVLAQILRELEVECLPKDLPDRIEVDVTSLQIGENIHANQLKVPKEVTVLTHADVSIFTVSAPLKEEVVAPTATLTEPELIKKKEDGEEGAAATPAKAGDAKAGAKPAGDAKAEGKPADKKADKK